LTQLILEEVNAWTDQKKRKRLLGIQAVHRERLATIADELQGE
jgi:hypothetical protein